LLIQEQDEDHPAPKPEHVIPELILASLNAVDQEIRPALLSNIVIVGAASQQKGLVKRFDNEIKSLFPGPNVRLHTGSTTGERSFAAWIGGSILASLGSFHQVSFCAFRRTCADGGSCGFRGRSTASMGRAS
jgi:actin-related protein 4